MPREKQATVLERIESWLWRVLVLGLIIMVLHATIAADGAVGRFSYGYWFGRAYEPGRTGLTAAAEEEALPVLSGGTAPREASGAAGDRGAGEGAAGGDERPERIRLLLNGRSSMPELVAWVNGEPQGRFERAVLTIAVQSGDVVALSGVEPGGRVTVQLIGRSRGLSGPPLGSRWEVPAEGVVLPIP